MHDESSMELFNFLAIRHYRELFLSKGPRGIADKVVDVNPGDTDPNPHLGMILPCKVVVQIKSVQIHQHCS